MSVEKLVKWAGKHFVFSMSKDMAYERIEEFLETQRIFQIQWKRNRKGLKREKKFFLTEKRCMPQ